MEILILALLVLGVAARPPCPAGGDRDNDLGPFSPDSGFERPPGKPDQDGRGDRYPGLSPPIGEEGAEPGSGRPDRPRRRGKGGRRERPERPQRGGGRRERPQRPQRPEGERRRNPGRRPNRGPFGGTTPSAMHQGQRQFFPIFKSENITLENTTDLDLHEGDNTFILPKAGRRRRPKKVWIDLS
ncbi:hypothetical protein AAFF_G00273340 [Aldrovandia affinis]|uniref:Uncharacterized protein n=1 Tax=Aldrovandia affinis TaxID=143900 RepID=A0AAD7SRG1_9TELE|nr:hypothetical protein AAFF_G00273340 [Aldrovandia affinis]